MSKRVSQLTLLTSVESTDLIPIVDVSTGQTKRVTVATLVGIPDFSWTASGETWTYSSYNSTTRIGVITVPTDATLKYSKGMRVKITQSTGGTKYGIIHDVTSTTLHVFMQSGKTLANETITSPFYSAVDALGFPKEESSWGLEVTSTAQQSTIGAVAGTWYNVGSNSLQIGRGAWRVQTRIGYQLNPNPASAGSVWYCTISNANNTEWNQDLTEHFEVGMSSATAVGIAATHDIDKEIEVTADTTLYINMKCNIAGNLYIRGELVRTKLRVVSAYL